MAEQSRLQGAILSSPREDGRRRGGWFPALIYSVSKPCGYCGKEFRPWIGQTAKDSMKRVEWKKQIFCSISCAKKQTNPMSNLATRRKLSNTLKRIGHKPTTQGGNGRSLTAPQTALLAFLGNGWQTEYAVPTGRKGNGIASNYKLDLANVERKIGIEVDGQSHFGRRKLLDQKKDAFLATLGWKVYRVKNENVLRLCSTCTSADTLLTLLTVS